MKNQGRKGRLHPDLYTVHDVMSGCMTVTNVRSCKSSSTRSTATWTAVRGLNVHLREKLSRVHTRVIAMWTVVESARCTSSWTAKEYTTYSTLTWTVVGSARRTPTWTADWLWFWLWLYATYTMTYHWQSSRHKRSGVDDMVLLPQVGKHWISNF